jgi:hypothetical protein
MKSGKIIDSKEQSLVVCYKVPTGKLALYRIFRLWKISVFLDFLLDCEDEGIIFLLNSVIVYQLTLCDIPTHLDHH